MTRLQKAAAENFPVASWWLPFQLKKPLKLIYQFARTADDIVDEGNDSISERSQQLDLLEHELLLGGRSTLPWIRDLNTIIKEYQIPIDLFLRLLSGFRTDLYVHRYQDFNQLWNYCQQVAHPIGHLWLYLVGQYTPAHIALSDNLSTALQLTDCIQDVASDYQDQNRIYMPQEDWAVCGFKEIHLTDQQTPAPLRHLLALQSQRAESYLQTSLSLAQNIRGLAGLQLRLCQSGCAAILERCRQRSSHREVPRLKKKDWMLLLFHSFYGGNR